MFDKKMEYGPANLDDLEAHLMDVALEANSKEESIPRAVGRAIRALIPAYIAFLKAEIDRDEEHGPSDAIMALSRVTSLMLGLTCNMVIKKKDYTEALEALSELVKTDLKMVLDSAVIRKIGDTQH